MTKYEIYLSAWREMKRLGTDRAWIILNDEAIEVSLEDVERFTIIPCEE